MKKLKPIGVVFILGVAVVAFGLAGQQALSEGLAGAKEGGECASMSRSRCGMGMGAAIAKAAKGECSSEAKAVETADLNTKEGRSRKVMAEYAASRRAKLAANSQEGGGCCPAPMAAVAKAEGGACSTVAKAESSACGTEAKAESSACGTPAAETAELTGVHAALADMKSGKCVLTSGKYGPAVTAAVVTALYAVAEEEAAVSGTSCSLTAAKMASAKDEARENLCPVAMAKHGKTSETAAKAAVAAVQAIDRGSCPYSAVAAAIPASEKKQGCEGEKSGCCGSCEESTCGKKCQSACLSQQAKADGASLGK